MIRVSVTLALYLKLNSACPPTPSGRECTSDHTRDLGTSVSDPRNTQKSVLTKGALELVCPFHQRMKLMSPRSRDQSPYEPLKRGRLRAPAAGQSCTLSQPSCKCQPPAANAPGEAERGSFRTASPRRPDGNAEQWPQRVPVYENICVCCVSSFSFKRVYRVGPLGATLGVVI